MLSRWIHSHILLLVLELAPMKHMSSNKGNSAFPSVSRIPLCCVQPYTRYSSSIMCHHIVSYQVGLTAHRREGVRAHTQQAETVSIFMTCALCSTTAAVLEIDITTPLYGRTAFEAHTLYMYW